MLVLLCSVFSKAQEAYKYADVTNLRCDFSEVEPVYSLIPEMADKPDAKVEIIVFGMKGYMKRYANSVKNYFYLGHGLDEERISVFYGGDSDKGKMELWILPKGAKEPEINYISDDQNAKQFDSYIYNNMEYCGEKPPSRTSRIC